MTLVAVFSLPVESFALAETLPEFPGIAVETDRIAAHSPDVTLPSLWVSDSDTDGFGEAMADDRTVEEIQSTESFDTERLYYVKWSSEVERLVEEIIDHEGVILSATGQNDRWKLRIRFMTHDQIDDFQSHFEEHGPSFDLEQLFEVDSPRQRHGNVTPEQQQALKIASEVGYFGVPRDASTKDVAELLDVSHQAVSERIRRGTDNLVREMLFVDPIDEDPDAE